MEQHGGVERLPANNSNTNNNHHHMGNGRIRTTNGPDRNTGVKPIIPTSSREAQMLYYPWTVPANSHSPQPPSSSSRNQSRQQQQPLINTNNTSFAALISDVTTIKPVSPVSFLTKPSSFTNSHPASASAVAAETYENVPPTTTTTTQSSGNYRNPTRPLTTTGPLANPRQINSNIVSATMSTVPPIPIYTDTHTGGNTGSSVGSMPARLLPLHHHHHLRSLGSDLLSSPPPTSATFLSSSKDARVGFNHQNAPHSPTLSSTMFDYPNIARSAENVAAENNNNSGRTSRGSVAERVMWFEGFPQAPPGAAVNVTSVTTTSGPEGVQVVHYTTHEHRGADGALIRSRSRRSASSSYGAADLQPQTMLRSGADEDSHVMLPAITDSTFLTHGTPLPAALRAAPKPSSEYNMQQQQYAAPSSSRSGIMTNRSSAAAAYYSPPNPAAPNEYNNFRSQQTTSAAFGSSSGVQEATFPLSTSTTTSPLRAEQHRVIPIMLETAASTPAFTHPRLQQPISGVLENQQQRNSDNTTTRPLTAGPGLLNTVQQTRNSGNRSQSIPALSLSNPTTSPPLLLLSSNSTTSPTSPPSSYLASYKRQHEQLQRTGLQQILDSLDFNKLFDDAHGHAFGQIPPSSNLPAPSWASRPFSSPQNVHAQRSGIGGAKLIPSDTSSNITPPPPPPRRLSSAAARSLLHDEHWPFGSSFGSNFAAATASTNSRKPNAVERTIPIMVSDGPATPLRTAASRNKTPPPASAVAAAVAAAAKQKLAAAAAATASSQPPPSELQVIAPSPSTVLTQHQQEQHHFAERVMPTSMPPELAATVAPASLATSNNSSVAAPLKTVFAGRQQPGGSITLPLNSTAAAAMHIPIPTPATSNITAAVRRASTLDVNAQQPKLPEKIGTKLAPGGAAAANAFVNMRPKIGSTSVGDGSALVSGGVADSNTGEAAGLRAVTEEVRKPQVATPAESGVVDDGSTKHKLVPSDTFKAFPQQSNSVEPSTTTNLVPKSLPHHDVRNHYQANKLLHHQFATIPRFYYPRGKPMAGVDEAEFNEYVTRERLQRYFPTISGSGRHEFFTLKEMAVVAKVLQVPHYWKAALFKAFGGNKETDVVTEDAIIATWKRIIHQNFDDEARFLALLAKPGTHYLEPSDFVILIQDIVDEHPGLNILKEAPEFHARYVNTIIARIFFEINRSWSGKITLAELRRSKLLNVLRMLDKETDINLVTDFFSYEHFYVVYCKFWELDQDHDLIISREDLSRHHEGAMNPLIVERIFSGAVTRGEHQKRGQMTYPEFVWFLLAEEDKRNPRSIEYWFRCMDLDGDGYLTLYELEYFYAKQAERMKELGLEPLAFCDIATQMFDMIKPKHARWVRLSDLKRCKLTPIFLDTFTNLEKYILHEHRDPFANSKHLEDPELEGLSDWCKYAAEEYEYLVSEEAASNASSANETPSSTPTNFTTLTPSTTVTSPASAPDEKQQNLLQLDAQTLPTTENSLHGISGHPAFNTENQTSVLGGHGSLVPATPGNDLRPKTDVVASTV